MSSGERECLSQFSQPLFFGAERPTVEKRRLGTLDRAQFKPDDRVLTIVHNFPRRRRLFCFGGRILSERAPRKGAERMTALGFSGMSAATGESRPVVHGSY